MCCLPRWDFVALRQGISKITRLNQLSPTTLPVMFSTWGLMFPRGLCASGTMVECVGKMYDSVTL